MKNKAIYIVLFIYAIIATFTIIFFDGTGGAGDSILHFLYAKYAPIHPQLFFNHWAKPVYVLLVCPFAQFGFTGVKIFNAIVTIISVFFTFKIAQELNLKNAIIAAVILIFSPLYFALTFSGLTEPLFALFISIGIYAILKHKNIAACLIISFLPFIRSEGLIIIGVFAFYFLLKKKWKFLPLLLFGNVVYSIAGFFVYHDFLWVFTKIPYAKLSSTYGDGRFFHFVDQLIYIVGVPIYLLFWLGIIGIIWKSIKRKTNLELQVLVFLSFLAFFVAHSLFWYLGIFNSMGLKRVLIGVMPLISIISLVGFNFISEDIFKKRKIPKLIIQFLLISYILIFPFTKNPAAINWEKDFKLSKDQQTAIQIADYITQNIGTDHRFVFAHPYLSEVLKIDHFDNKKRLELNQDFMYYIKSGDIVIWENWFCIVEHGVKKEQLDNISELKNIYNLSVEKKGRDILYSVYICE